MGRTCGFLFLCRLTHKLFIRHKMSVSGSLKRFIPLFDRILVQRAEAMTKTKGGIIIPEKSQGKVLEGTVVAAGPVLVMIKVTLFQCPFRWETQFYCRNMGVPSLKLKVRNIAFSVNPTSLPSLPRSKVS